jgi:hypothetical protein
VGGYKPNTRLWAQMAGGREGQTIAISACRRIDGRHKDCLEMAGHVDLVLPLVAAIHICVDDIQELLDIFYHLEVGIPIYPHGHESTGAPHSIINFAITSVPSPSSGLAFLSVTVEATGA